MTAAGDGAVLAVPLRTKKSIIGALSIADEPGRVFTPAETALLQAFADQAAVALERARLHEQTEARSAEIETAAARDRILAEASRVLAASLDLDTTLRDMTQVIVPALADWCTVRVIERDGRMRRVATTCADPSKAHLIERISELAPTGISGAGGAIGEAIRSGHPLLLRDLRPAWLDAHVPDRDYLAIVHEVAPRSVMLAPLVVRGRTVGAITFVRTRDERPYDEADLAIARDLASRAGLAIENARLLEQREQARLDAETANRSKDEFLAVLSHELRTPLTSILGWVRILRTTPTVAQRLATGLEVIERNARAQAQLINDLLDVSRIVAGKLQLDRSPVDLDPVVMQAVDSLSGEADAQGIIVDRAVPESRVRVLGDPTRLHQILTNLISNAIKFTGAGGRVTVALVCTAERATISVSDTGAGIAPELLPHVFDRFRQADSTTTRTHGGLGLGLAIVRHLVELHGGTVRAESPGPGQGATFVVELPLDASPVTARKATASAPATGLRLAGVSVLVVDDDPDARELMCIVAEGHGATARAVESAADALATLRLVTPDIIITDLGMPGEDGYGFLRSLRALGPPVANVPVVTLTAYAGAEDRERALAAGFAAHVSKPVDPETLVQVLADVRAHATASTRA
jgi:signal transduction histidine kinase/ActR/RegA family two-component response regulator